MSKSDLKNRATGLQGQNKPEATGQIRLKQLSIQRDEVQDSDSVVKMVKIGRSSHDDKASDLEET